MYFVYLSAPALAYVVLAAHFVRAQWWPLALLALAGAVLVWVPHRRAAQVAQAGLVLGALEWLRTLAALAAVRVSLGQPYLRMAAILLAVALLTALAALVYRSARVRARLER